MGLKTNNAEATICSIELIRRDVLGVRIPIRPINPTTHRPTVDEGAHLLTLRNGDLAALVAAADEIRREDVGEIVTYVVNRNVNWTNICFVGCKFCAFAHYKNDKEAYDRPMSAVLDKVRDGINRGATEVCMQGGINPEMAPEGYFDILDAVRGEFPKLHIHAYSPMEIQYGARRMGMDYPEYIGILKEKGIDLVKGSARSISFSSCGSVAQLATRATLSPSPWKPFQIPDGTVTSWYASSPSRIS